MIHNISYRVFVHGTEKEIKVLEALKNIFPNPKPERELSQGHHKNEIIILHQKLVKKDEIKPFLRKLLESESREHILNNLDKKMDDKGNLFIRLSKQDAFLGKWKVVEHGDSIHIRLKFAAYPAKKKVALKLAQEWLD